MSINVNESFEAQNGFVVEGAAGLFSAVGSPSFDAPLGSIYIDSSNSYKFKKMSEGPLGWVRILDFQGEGGNTEECLLIAINEQKIIYNDQSFLVLKKSIAQLAYSFYNSVTIFVDELLGIKNETTLEVLNEFGQIKD